MDACGELLCSVRSSWLNAGFLPAGWGRAGAVVFGENLEQATDTQNSLRYPVHEGERQSAADLAEVRVDLHQDAYARGIHKRQP